MMRQQSPLTKASLLRPIYAQANEIIITPLFLSINPPPSRLSVYYIRKPKQAQWAYVVVNDKPLYNDNISVDFELHASEETELVYKILKLAGVNLKAPQVVQVAAGMEQSQLQQEKK